MKWLAIGFAVTALLYASVGFGGGSTYNALLILAGTDYRILPSVALICNIIVVAGGTVRHAVAGTIPWSRLWPILLLSAPFAWAGGRLVVSQTVFLTILTILLFAASTLMLVQRDGEKLASQTTKQKVWPVLTIGPAVGFVSGIAGIGGGIFLAPLLYLTRWGRAVQISAAASLFILVNSVAGLAGQWTKLTEEGLAGEISDYWPLMLAVLVGGQLGSYLGLKIFPPKLIRIGTAILIAYVAVRLTMSLWNG